MAFPFTSDVAEVQDRFPDRQLTDAELVFVLSRLDDAETYLLARFPNLAARVSAGMLAAAAVQRVQVEMVLRVLRNPDGKSQESIDDYSWRRDGAVSSGLLYATDDELAELTPQAGTLRLGTVRIGSYHSAGAPTTDVRGWL